MANETGKSEKASRGACKRTVPAYVDPRTNELSAGSRSGRTLGMLSSIIGTIASDADRDYWFGVWLQNDMKWAESKMYIQDEVKKTQSEDMTRNWLMGGGADIREDQMPNCDCRAHQGSSDERQGEV